MTRRKWRREPETRLVFTIDRAKWRVGYRHMRHGLGDVQPLNRDGFMCIMGQIGHQAGVPAHILMAAQTSDATVRLINSTFAGRHELPEALTYHAQEINDDDYIEDDEREDQLVRLFEEYDIELRFIGDYVD